MEKTDGKIVLHRKGSKRKTVVTKNSKSKTRVKNLRFVDCVRTKDNSTSLQLNENRKDLGK